MITRERLEEYAGWRDWDDPDGLQHDATLMASALLVLEWREITAEDWPTVDEQGRSLEVAAFNEDGSIKYLSSVSGREKCTAVYWTSTGYTHFRPISAPARTGQGEK